MRLHPAARRGEACIGLLHLWPSARQTQVSPTIRYCRLDVAGVGSCKSKLNMINTLVPADLHGMTAGKVLMLRALICQRWIQLASMHLPSCDARRLRPTHW